MDIKTEHVIIAFAIAAAIIFLCTHAYGEHFASKREKAEAIATWSHGGDTSYLSYRNKIPGADIVEYNDVKRILANSPDVSALTGAVGKYK